MNGNGKSYRVWAAKAQWADRKQMTVAELDAAFAELGGFDAAVRAGAEVLVGRIGHTALAPLNVAERNESGALHLYI